MIQSNYPSDIKWTKQRKVVYEILEESKEPISVQEIYNRFLQKEAKEICAISTIYRVLATFEEKEIVTKSNIMGIDTALYSLKDGEHQHYAICVNCHKKIPLKECPFEHLSNPIEHGEFVVTGHRVELYGYCKECKNKI